MSELRSLGYMGVQSADFDGWKHFAAKLAGLQVAEQTGKSLAFRMDDRKQRLVVHNDSQNPAAYFGWETADADSLSRVAARLEKAGVKVERGTRALADQRRVKDLIAFDDPVGNRVEVFYDAEVTTDPFRPGRAISGFRTGPLGMGHAVLTVKNIQDVLPFYQDVLGFKLSDYSLRPFPAYFFHVNERHHSLAFVQTAQNGIHHLMLELFSLDDVGQAYDLAQGEEGRVGVTLGRHTNDFMTSFYAWTPSKFMVELGWGGRSIDVATWQPIETKIGPSLWGHDRSWLSPELRAEARAIRLDAAAQGARQPVQVIAGNHQLLPGECPWWDSTVSTTSKS